MIGWATVMVTGGCEAIAERVLDSIGYEVYLPRYRAVLKGARLLPTGRRVRSRTDTVIYRPLFTGYLFAAINDETPSWYAINNSLHVRRVIMSISENEYDEKPIILRNDVIAELKRRQDAGEWDEVTDIAAIRARFDAGEDLTVSMPHLGIIGHLSSLDENGRARVLSQMLGSATLTVEATKLKIVSVNHLG